MTFRATEPFDVICLVRSPGFTPEAADAIYDEIRGRFIDETVIAGSPCSTPDDLGRTRRS
jgi:hypothetical protein